MPTPPRASALGSPSLSPTASFHIGTPPQEPVRAKHEYDAELASLREARYALSRANNAQALAAVDAQIAA
eukprot:3227325-Lingulodinium_polyedra.AAC.1